MLCVTPKGIRKDDMKGLVKWKSANAVLDPYAVRHLGSLRNSRLHTLNIIEQG